MAFRFRAYGERQYLTLGTDAEGWSRARAETELQNVLADVRRGTWRAPSPEPAPKPADDPTFHEFASEWWASKREEVGANTRVGRNRKLKAIRPPGVWLDRAEQIEALLEAARELDMRARPDRRDVPASGDARDLGIRWPAPRRAALTALA